MMLRVATLLSFIVLYDCKIFVEAFGVNHRTIATSTGISRREEAFRVRVHLKEASKTSNSRDETRKRRTIKLRSGNKARLLSRTVEINPDWKITVWEWEKPAEVVDHYWQAQTRKVDYHGRESSMEKQRLLDPFGLVLWPGSVVAAQELRVHSTTIVQNKSVLVLGGGVGVEAQALAELGAKYVYATDIHPTTLQQLKLGVEENISIEDSGIVETAIFDLFSDSSLPMPTAELIVVADVLYNEDLAKQVASRLSEAWQRNMDIKLLVTDSQRFVDFHTMLMSRLNEVAIQMSRIPPMIRFSEKTLNLFTGSGVCIDEDQTYDVTVRKIWIGLDI